MITEDEAFDLVHETASHTQYAEKLIDRLFNECELDGMIEVRRFDERNNAEHLYSKEKLLKYIEDYEKGVQL